MCAYLCHGDAWMVSRGAELVSAAGSGRFITEGHRNACRDIIFNEFQQPCTNFCLHQSTVGHQGNVIN